MAINTIDAKTLVKMFLAGAKNLETKKEWINELNVFPVPDGDTGTNMTLTMLAAVREVKQIEIPDMESVSKAISSGSLRGARGNSGVILSQLFRGFTKEIREHQELDEEILAKAFHKAVETAYKAVMKPKEGTILTVARGIAEKASELAEKSDDLNTYLEALLKHGDYVLSQTPEMLPVLKEAGVVDSGGQGLMEVLRGACDAFAGRKTVSIEFGNEPVAETAITAAKSAVDIRFGYCTEFIIMLEKEYTTDTEREFKSYLNSIGDSIVVVSDEEIVKVHVHTNDPGLAIQRALTYGALTNMKIDNMREEHQERLIKETEKIEAGQALEERAGKAAKPEEPKKDFGFIAVSIGEGINQIFSELGVDYIIEGGQTMNPSTDDMLNAIENVNADTVFILPNNKNIVLAANQAKQLAEDKKVIVIPTKTIPQGIAAVISFIAEKTAEDNEARMLEEIKRVRTGQVTYAVRDTSIDGIEISQNDIMGIGDSSILAVGKDIDGTAMELVKNLVDEESELISIYYGADIDGGQAAAFAEAVMKSYPDCDVEVHFGGQPIYYYLISVE